MQATLNTAQQKMDQLRAVFAQGAEKVRGVVDQAKAAYDQTNDLVAQAEREAITAA